MSEQPPFDRQQLRALLLPELIYTVVGPYLIYRLASPQLSPVNALLLAALLPIFRLVVKFVRYRRLSLLGVMSLFTVAIKLVSGLLFQDARLILVSESLITGIYGILMIGSVLIGKPLIWAFIQNIMANNPAVNQRITSRWQAANAHVTFTGITAVWGIGLLLEFIGRVFLVYSLTTE